MVSIQKLSEIQIPQTAFRVKKYFLIYCESGGLTIQVDDKEIFLKKNEVLTITSGQYHFIKSNRNAAGYMLGFTLDYIAKTEKDIELIFQNSLFCHFDYNEVITVKNKPAIALQLQLIMDELKEKPFQYLNSIHSRIELILVDINRAKIENGAEIWKPEALFLRFLEAVRNNFEHNYTVPQLAKQLGTTEIKLNEQAKLHAGKTAQNVIYGLVTSEAKRLLTYENLSVKEVAYQLGFNDPFYFSNFFKKQTKISPKLYKEQNSL